MTKTGLFLFLSFLFCQAHAIVGGQVVPAAETTIYEMTPRLSISSKEASTPSTCTGTLIADDIILTAAHCLDDHPTDLEVTAFFGSLAVKAQSYVLHPDYTPQELHIDERGKKQARGGLYDIALVRLKSTLPDFKKALLPTPLTLLRDNTPVLIVGYGRASEYEDSGGVLRWGSTYASVYKEKRLYLAGNAAICSGDSGGPAYLQQGANFTVVGVTSNGDCLYSSKHTQVSAFRSWIETALLQLKSDR